MSLAQAFKNFQTSKVPTEKGHYNIEGVCSIFAGHLKKVY